MTSTTDSIPGLERSTSQRSEIVLVRDLARADRDAMYALHARYFVAPERRVFERDLDEKEWVVVLRDEAGAIDGFSTLMRMHVRGATVFFSGDTVVARHRWGSSDLPRLWSRHVFAQANGATYWFLISSGYRTYRYLPVFFKGFVPAFDRETPPEMKQLLDAIAIAKFGSQYDPATGVVRLATPSPLREGISDPGARAEHDPHVAFFLDANPGHAQGDELACLVRIDPECLTSAGRRMIGQR